MRNVFRGGFCVRNVNNAGSNPFDQPRLKQLFYRDFSLNDQKGFWYVGTGVRLFAKERVL